MKEGVITTSHLEVKTRITGIKNEKFQEVAQDAKQNCPVSKAYAALEITMEAALKNDTD
jgi:osmotically inducible protein OsmC